MRKISIVAVLLVAAAWVPVRTEAASSGDLVSSWDYPKDVYLTGVGEGPTQEKAADNARTEIAKVFSLEVRAHSQSSAREVSDGPNSSFSQDVSDDVQTFTTKIIEGVEIARYWRNESGTHYALAVLDRAHSLKVFRDKILTGDREFVELSERLGRTEGKFARIRIALRLVRLEKSRQRFNADYRLLNPDGSGIEEPVTYQESLVAARKAVTAVTVQVDAQGVGAARVTSRIIDTLSAYGLRSTEKTERKPDVLVEAVAAGHNLPAENLTWYWAEGSIAVKMSYGSTGEVITRFEEYGQDTSGARSSAVGKTLVALSEKTAARIFKILISGDLLD